MSTSDEIQQMLADCEARESKLSEWESGFIDDISTKLGRGQSLTSNQAEKLEQIWERITS